MSTRAAVAIVSSALVLFGPGVSRAVAVGVYDGFEDGNWTANPVWFDGNPGYGIDGGIVADPVRPSNLVWKAQGTPSGADRVIATTDFAPMSWVGFHSSVEIFASGGFYNAEMTVADSWQAWSQGTSEGFLVSFDDGHNGHTSLGITEYNPTGSVLHRQNWDSSEAPPNEWRQVNLWHDPVSGLIKADVRRLSDGHVYVETSIVPMSLGESPLALLWLGAGGPGGAYWNHLDNPTLTPEPATFLLLAIGGLAVRRRR